MSEWLCLRASDFGAPHRRERVFVVAHDPRVRSRAWRAESARFSGQANADSTSAADVAYSPGAGQQERARTTGLHGEFNTSGSAILAHADHDRRRQRESEQEPERGRGSAANAGKDGAFGDVADASSTRLPIWRGCGSPEAGNAATDRCGEGPLESRLGGMPYGTTGGMDSPRWPAGPGEEQRAWEPPRVVYEKMIDRVARLKALGNSCVWLCAAHVGAMIIRTEQGQ